MMRRQFTRALPWLALAGAGAGLRAHAHAQGAGDGKVWLRVRNDSPEAFTHV